MGVGSIGHAFSSATKSVTKPLKKVTSNKVVKTFLKGAVIVATAGAGGLLLLGGKKLLSHKLKKAGSSGGTEVETEEATSIIDASEENAKKSRARILATEGGVLGEEIDDLQKKSGRNILGN